MMIEKLLKPHTSLRGVRYERRSNLINSLNCKMKYGGCTYIMTNKYNTTLYVGVTSDLQVRAWQHKTHFFDKSFAKKYNLTKLVYYENFLRIEEAIAREKQLKGGSRAKKIALINAINPEWKDLYEEVSKW